MQRIREIDDSENKENKNKATNVARKQQQVVSESDNNKLKKCVPVRICMCVIVCMFA